MYVRMNQGFLLEINSFRKRKCFICVSIHGFMRFSCIEIYEIAKALFAVSLMFALAYVGFSFALLTIFPMVLLTVGVGFVLHELGHKFLAQKYGCWAEFRSNNQMLLVGLLISITGFVLAAPGGVYIRGATRSQHGRIALAGPLVNIILASLFGILNLLMPSMIFKFGFSINALLGLFNLIPFPPFDGHAVLQWNKFAFGVALALAIILFGLSFV